MYFISTSAHSTAGDETKDGRGIQGRAETVKEGGDLRFLVVVVGGADLDPRALPESQVLVYLTHV